MPITWPVELTGIEWGWNERKLDNRVKSETDAGPAKYRRRFTRAVRRLSISIQLTPAKMAILDAFHTETLKDGTLPFEMVNPVDGETYSFRWVSELDRINVIAGLYRTAIELEFVP